MEIQTLKLLITEAEANQLLQTHAPDTGSLENLAIRITPEGVVVQGEYPALMMRVAFETVWTLSVDGPEVVAKLASVRVAGFPAGILTGALMRMLRDAVAGSPGIRVQDDAVRVHAEELARQGDLTLSVRFSAVRCSVGVLVLEAGNPA
jgi:hypothetical protein